MNDVLIDVIEDVLFEVLNVLVYFSLFHLESVQFYPLEHERIHDIHVHPKQKLLNLISKKQTNLLLEVKKQYVLMKLLLVVQQDL